MPDNDTAILTAFHLDGVRCMGIGCTCDAAYKLRLLQMTFYICRDCMARIAACYKAMQEMNSCK